MPHSEYAPAPEFQPPWLQQTIALYLLYFRLCRLELRPRGRSLVDYLDLGEGVA